MGWGGESWRSFPFFGLFFSAFYDATLSTIWKPETGQLRLWLTCGPWLPAILKCRTCLQGRTSNPSGFQILTFLPLTFVSPSCVYSDHAIEWNKPTTGDSLDSNPALRVYVAPVAPWGGGVGNERIWVEGCVDCFLQRATIFHWNSTSSPWPASPIFLEKSPGEEVDWSCLPKNLVGYVLTNQNRERVLRFFSVLFTLFLHFLPPTYFYLLSKSMVATA